VYWELVPLEGTPRWRSLSELHAELVCPWFCLSKFSRRVGLAVMFSCLYSTPPNQKTAGSRNGRIHQLLIPINITSTTSRTSSSTTWSGSYQRH
jgi:hypothetical protein